MSLKIDAQVDIQNFFLKKNGIKKLSLHEPKFDQLDELALKSCIKSGFVSTKGKLTKNFEDKIKSYTKSKYVVSVLNGTTGLEVALKVLGVNYNHEVLLPSLTFVATANAISYRGAIPHFVDSSVETLGIDTEKLKHYLKKISELTSYGLRNKKTGRKIAAIIPVHCFGHPMQIDDLILVAKNYKIKVIEDATEALGSFYKKKHVGTFGDIGVLSFNGNKIITSGGGGALLINKTNTAKRIMHLVSTAKINHPYFYVHDQIGWNYRLPSLNAALGISQLRKLKFYLKKKRILARRYKNFFKNNKNIIFMKEPKNTKSNYWLNTVFIKKSSIRIRDSILHYLNNKKICCRPAWQLLSKSLMYRNCPKDNLDNALLLEKSLINLPSSYYLVK
jgi:perosamine synthetase